MLYTKMLRLSSAVKGSMGVGAIVNLQSNDAAKIWALPQYMHVLWSGPFQVGVGVLWWCCGGVGVYVYV